MMIKGQVNMKVRFQSKRARKTLVMQPEFHRELVILKNKLGLKGLSDLVLLYHAIISLQAEREGKTLEEYLREFLSQIG